MAGTIQGARVTINVEANSGQAAAQLNAIDKELNKLDKNLRQTDTDANKLKSTLDKKPSSGGLFGSSQTAATLAIGAVTALAYATGQFVVSAVRASAQMEQWSTSFRVLTGDVAVARDLLNDIREFGAVTPFETAELVPAAQMLLGMGTAAEDIIDTLGMVGDVAAGLNVPIGEMSYLFGQMQSQGKAMTQDLNQFAARGVPIYRTLAEMLNTNVAGVRRMAEQGQISFPLIQDAFRRMTEEGGQFHDMMEEQSKTLAGRWSTFNDLLSESAVTFGDQLNPALKDTLQMLTELLSSDPGQTTFMQQFGATIGEIVTEINMAVQSMRILKAYLDGASESQMASLVARFDEMEALRMRYMTVMGGGDLVRLQDGIEYQQNVAGMETGYIRPLGTTQWQRGPNAPGGTGPGGTGPGGGTPGGTGPGGPSALQQASIAADEAMAAYEEQENAYKNLLMAKAEADKTADAARVEQQMETWKSVLDIASTAINGIMNLQSMATNADLQRADNDYAKKKKWIMANVKDEKEREKQLAELDEEHEKKVSDIKRKAAKETKALMLMNAIVQTAAGITNALAASGNPYAAVAMAVLIGAMGAAQIALISSTPIPEKAQYGGSFMVPPGYEADSALLRVNSGEKVDVTPERFSGQENGEVNINIDGESMRGYITREINRAVNNGNVQIRRQSAVRVS